MEKLNKFLLIIVFLTLITAFTGCDNRLTESPSGLVTEENFNFDDSDFRTSLGSVYAQIRQSPNFNHRGFHMAQETSGDGMVMPANLAGGWDDGGVYRRINHHEWNSEQQHIEEMWNAFYSGVLNANRIIGLIEEGRFNIPSSIGEEKVLSEMRVARAWYYWLILDNFGDAPLITNRIVDASELPAKSSREELYNFVVTEITESMPNLSDLNNTEMYGRFNIWAAKALLVNVYLNAEVYIGQAEWGKVIEQTNDIINSGEYILDDNYSDVFATNNHNSPEIIFSIPFDEIQTPGAFNVWQYSWPSELKQKIPTEATPWGSGTLRPIPQFLDIYDTTDIRLENDWIKGPQYTPNGDPIMGSFDKSGEHLILKKEMKNGVAVSIAEGYRVNKFEVKEGALSGLSNDFPFFRYAGVLMMKAEALLRTNKANEAAQLVTQVRQRVFDDPNKATVTGAELQMDSEYEYGFVENYQIVDQGNQDPIEFGRFLDELGREFVLEAHRRRDMIRFGVFTKKSWLSKRASEDFRTVFPIPQAVINTNPNIEQNPDYN